MKELGNNTKGEETTKLSLHAIQGTTEFQTMRIRGETKNKEAIMPIDSSSSQNFISVGKALRLECWQRYQFGVTIEDSKKVKTTGKCKQVKWNIQRHNLLADFCVLPVKGYDAVLGVQWLTTLRPILWDFKKMTLQFQINSKWVTLRGIQPTQFDLASEKKNNKAIFLHCKPSTTLTIVLSNDYQ